VDIYVTLILQYTPGALAQIAQFYLQITPCLPLPHILISIHQMALPLTCDNARLIAAYYSSIQPERIKGWVGLVGWPTADSLPT